MGIAALVLVVVGLADALILGIFDLDTARDVLQVVGVVLVFIGGFVLFLTAVVDPHITLADSVARRGGRRAFGAFSIGTGLLGTGVIVNRIILRSH